MSVLGNCIISIYRICWSISRSYSTYPCCFNQGILQISRLILHIYMYIYGNTILCCECARQLHTCNKYHIYLLEYKLQLQHLAIFIKGAPYTLNITSYTPYIHKWKYNLCSMFQGCDLCSGATYTLANTVMVPHSIVSYRGGGCHGIPP